MKNMAHSINQQVRDEIQNISELETGPIKENIFKSKNEQIGKIKAKFTAVFNLVEAIK